MKKPFLQEEAKEAARFLKALANSRRLHILCLLVQHPESCVADLVEKSQISQPILSQHLAKMRAENLVDCRREGQKQLYLISDPRVLKLLKTLKEQFCPDEKPL